LAVLKAQQGAPAARARVAPASAIAGRSHHPHWLINHRPLLAALA
jgi:hypothetical protein